jgi:hypothetical protein
VSTLILNCGPVGFRLGHDGQRAREGRKLRNLDRVHLTRYANRYAAQPFCGRLARRMLRSDEGCDMAKRTRWTEARRY